MPTGVETLGPERLAAGQSRGFDTTGEHRRVAPPGDGLEATDVVAVGVGNEDEPDGFRRQAVPGHAGEDLRLLPGDTGVDERATIARRNEVHAYEPQ